MRAFTTRRDKLTGEKTMTFHSRSRFTKRYLTSSIVIALLLPAAAPAQVAGSTLLGVETAEVRDLAAGWSVKHQILGSSVFNEKNERIGAVDDIIVAPDSAVSYVIVGAGGFLGVDRHDVAVPVSQLKLQDGKLVLPGATKEALRASPEFEYTSYRK